MKIIIISLFMSLLINQSVSTASTFNTIARVGDESYVEDIPFNTLSIYESYRTSTAFFSSGKELADESYINDIPFNTSEIARFSTPGGEKVLSSRPADEVYVDDIPFDTKTIADNFLKSEVFEQDFDSFQFASTELETLKVKLVGLIATLSNSSDILEITIPGGMTMTLKSASVKDLSDSESADKIHFHLNIPQFGELPDSGTINREHTIDIETVITDSSNAN
jgi:hypothetical protein